MLLEIRVNQVHSKLATYSTKKQAVVIGKKVASDALIVRAVRKYHYFIGDCDR